MSSRSVIYGDVAPIPEPTARQKPAPLVAPVEPTGGYWSNDNNWGQSRVFLPGYPHASYPLVPAEIGILQQTKLPGPPRCRTIYLGREDTLLRDYSISFAGADQGSEFLIYAKVTIGVGGGVSTFLVDWSTAVLNVVASTIAVNAVFAPVRPGLPYKNQVAISNPPPVYVPMWGGRLTAFIGSDPSPFFGQNTFTQPLDPMAANSVNIFDIPAQAVAYSLSPPSQLYNPPDATGSIVMATHKTTTVNPSTTRFGLMYSNFNQKLALGMGGQTLIPGQAKGIEFRPGPVAVATSPFLLTWFLGV